MKRMTLFFVASLCLLVTMTNGQTAMLGKSDLGVIRITHLTGTPVDSAVQTGTSEDFLYEITVVSVSATTGWASVRFMDVARQRYFTRSIKQGSTRSDIISNFRLVFNATLTAEDRSRVQYSHLVNVKTDSTGGLQDALWDVARSDSVVTLTAAATQVLLNNDYPRGLTVIANKNLAFRTNRITGWVYLFSGGSIYIPIRHTATDTLFARTSAIPDIGIIRGK
ncbi:MAG TPA: hypothetical protein PLY04_17855 [bacterium]|nr:hypothetical protein [bacterium]